MAEVGAEGASDGDDIIANFHFVAIPEVGGDQGVGFDPHDGHVGFGIVPDLERMDPSAVVEKDLDILNSRFLDDVPIGQHVHFIVQLD